MAKKKRKDKEPASSVSARMRSPWEYILYILCISLIIANIVIIGMVFEQSGWDYRVYTGTLQAVIHGENPYIMENVDKYSHLDGFPFPYPPHAIPFFFALDAVLPTDHGYYLLWSTFVIVSGLILLYALRTGGLPGHGIADPLILYTILVSGFLGTFWNFLTGNIAMMYLFLFSVIFCLAVRHRYYLSSVVLGLSASFTLFPILFSLAYLGIRDTWKQRIILVLIAGGTLAAVIAITALVDPVIFSAYLEQTFHGFNPVMEGSQSSTAVTFYIFNPTAYWFINQFLKLFGLHDSFLYPTLCVLYAGLVIGGIYLYMKKNREWGIELFSLAMVAIFLIVPRMKPYNFIFVLVPFYFLIRNYPVREQCIALATICLLPLVLFLLFPVFPGIWTAFGQFFALVLTYAFVIWYGTRHPGLNGPAGPQAGRSPSG